MKTYFLVMSDLALGEWLGFAASTLVLISNIFLQIRTGVIAKRQLALAKIQAELAATQASANESMNSFAEKQDKNIAQINGHMTKLLETTGELNRKIGYDERKEEQKPIIEGKVKAAEEFGILKGKEDLRTEQKNGGETVK